MNVLCIGNSFSQDATHYLHQIAASDSFDLQVTNLYIGGCSLERHYENQLSGNDAYLLEENGSSTGEYISLKSALERKKWNYISFQQCSRLSTDFVTYMPYIAELSEYVKIICPGAKQIIHQTWAYEENSQKLTAEMGFNTHEEMFFKIKSAYEKAAETIHAKSTVPSGEIFYKMTKVGIKNIYRDTLHAGYGAGRYALGLLWYKCLTGRNIVDNAFDNFDEPISNTDLQLIKDIVHSL